MAASDRVARDHRHDRFGQSPDLDVQIGDVKASDGLMGAGRRRIGPRHVAAATAPDALIAPGAESVGSLAGQDHDSDTGVLASALERVRELDHGLGAEGVAYLGSVDGDLGDARVAPGRQLITDVGVLAVGLPADAHNCSCSRCQTPGLYAES